MDAKKYYSTAFALYLTYFVLGIAASIMGQYKQEFAVLWGAKILGDGTYDVSGVVAVIAAIGLGRLLAFPVAGPLSDYFGRRISALIGCGFYAVFLFAVPNSSSIYLGYLLAIVSGMANSFLDTSITPSCMEIFREKGTIANIFTKLSISIAQFILPFAIGIVAAQEMSFHTIFTAAAILILVDGLFLAILPFPPFERHQTGKKREKMKFTPASAILIALGFTSSSTFMLWMNCNQELGLLYGLSDPSKIQSFYSVGIVLALFVSAALLKKNIKPVNILICYPAISFVTLLLILLIQRPQMCLAGGLLLGFFAAGGVLQLVTAVANEMFPKHRGTITSIVMISSSVANYLVITAAGILTKTGGANGPRLVLILNMGITLIGILLAVYLKKCLYDHVK